MKFHCLALKLLGMAGNDEDCVDDWIAVRKAVGGDTSAFEQLFQKHSPALFKFIASRLGRIEAEDALGDVWLNSWRAIKDGRYVETHFRGWVFQVARNQIVDRLRKRQKAPKHIENDDLIADSRKPPEMASELLKRQKDLRECVGDLPHEYAEIVTGYLMGCDHATNAKSLGIPLGTSHSRLSKAKPLLRQCMEHKGWSE